MEAKSKTRTAMGVQPLKGLSDLLTLTAQVNCFCGYICLWTGTWEGQVNSMLQTGVIGNTEYSTDLFLGLEPVFRNCSIL